MATSRFAVVRWLSSAWRLLDLSRRIVLNLLFLLILVALVVVAVKSRVPALADKTALVLSLKGPLAEQPTGADLRGTALSQLRGQPPQKIILRDVLGVLDAAAKDSSIGSVVLALDDFEGGGLASLREVAAALDRFKAAGKPVYAWGTAYDQRQYFLAARANQVWLDPMGMVYLDGFGRYRTYYRDALDKLGVTVNLIRVGTYKSFAEPYIANGSSPAAREAESYLYKGLWATYTEGVEQARKLPPGALASYIDTVTQSLASSGGDAARMALQAKMVDGLKTRDELRNWMVAHGAGDDEKKSFRQVSFDDYLARLPGPKLSGDAIGVVVAEGEIIDGDAPAGTVGGRSTAELVRQAREDKSIKAIVLRVNSPGGSVVGSEMVRRELELVRQAGKPVIVSMGDVAASGGYWISMSSDEVIADAGTITGSIGVFALLPSADKALAKLGVHTDGVTTTWLGGAGDPRRALDPRFAALVQANINHIYDDFTSRAAKARKTTAQKIDEVAQGRVWSGAQAKERGLVDRLGSYGDALAAAASRAKLAEGYRVVYVEREPGRLGLIAKLLGADALAAHFDLRLAPAGVPPQAAREMQHDIGWLSEIADAKKPFTALTHCLCTSP